MTFDEWWDTLSTREQNYIGKETAKFVWNSAIAAVSDKRDGLVDDEMPLFSDWDVTWTKSDT